MRRALLTGLVSFGGTALLLHLLLHLLWPAAPTLREAKLAAFDDARDEYSLVFVGTSFIHRQIIPRLFDEELQKLGLASRSFNLGVMGEDAGEAYWTLEQVLEKRPAKLRYVVLDANFPEPDGANLSTWRYLTWHSPSATWVTLRELWRSDLSFGAKLTAGSDNLHAFWQVTLGVGAAWRLWQPTNLSKRLGVEGYLALDALPELAAQHDELLKSAPEFRAEVAALAAGPTVVDETSFSRRMIVAMCELARRAGVTVIVLEGPVLSPPIRPSVEATILSFRDPQRYPALYAVENRFDRTHLNDRGAHEYTRLVAARLAEQLHALH